MIQRILNNINDKKEEIETLILTDNAKDYPSYRYLTGKLRGIEDTLEIIKGVIGIDDE